MNCQGGEKVVTETHPLFEDPETGWDMMKRLVYGPNLEDEEEREQFEEWKEQLKMSMPMRCRWCVDLYVRKHVEGLGRCIRQDDYGEDEGMGPITGYEHDEYWREKAANKAADSHMMHVNLVKALRKVYSMQEYMQAYGYECKVNDKEDKQGVGKGRHEKQWVLPDEVKPARMLMDRVRRVLNLAVESGHVYSAWEDEVLCTIPKVEGSSFIGDTRPIGLLAILRNAVMGILYRRVGKVWDKHGVLSQLQMGFRRGMGTTEARMIQTTMYEYGYLHGIDLAAGTEDKKHAFDSPTQTVGFQMGMMRLGMSDRLIRLDQRMNVQGRMMVRHARGMSPKFKRGGEDACGNGAVQGGEDSPQKWNIYEDPFNTYWEGMSGGLEMRVSDYRMVTLKGVGFADDKKPIVTLYRY